MKSNLLTSALEIFSITLYKHIDILQAWQISAEMWIAYKSSTYRYQFDEQHISNVRELTHMNFDITSHPT